MDVFHVTKATRGLRMTSESYGEMWSDVDSKTSYEILLVVLG